MIINQPKIACMAPLQAPLGTEHRDIAESLGVPSDENSSPNERQHHHGTSWHRCTQQCSTACRHRLAAQSQVCSLLPGVQPPTWQVTSAHQWASSSTAYHPLIYHHLTTCLLSYVWTCLKERIVCRRTLFADRNSFKCCDQSSSRRPER